MLTTLGDPGELWDAFKRDTFQAAKECIEEHSWQRCCFASEEMENMEESHAARLAGDRYHFGALSRRREKTWGGMSGVSLRKSRGISMLMLMTSSLFTEP